MERDEHQVGIDRARGELSPTSPSGRREQLYRAVLEFFDEFTKFLAGFEECNSLGRHRDNRPPITDDQIRNASEFPAVGLSRIEIPTISEALPPK